MPSGERGQLPLTLPIGVPGEEDSTEGLSQHQQGAGQEHPLFPLPPIVQIQGRTASLGNGGAAQVFLLA